MKYQSVFGVFGVVVDANSKDEAIKKTEKKISSYKNGSTKGDYIRKAISNGLTIDPLMVYFKDGFYREL